VENIGIIDFIEGLKTWWIVFQDVESWKKLCSA